MLEKSKLVKHQIYFYQSLFGAQWIMPISEVFNNIGICDHIDVLSSISLSDLVFLPKHDKLKDYLVEKEYNELYSSRRSQKHWVVPTDRYGIELFKHYTLNIPKMKNDIIIPLYTVKSEYPELIIKSGNSSYCNGITSEKEKSYRRDILLKSLIYE